MSDETLQTSGDHYYDEAENPGFVAVATRNVGKAKSAITSGEAGATAVATAIGFAVAAFVTGGIGD